MAGMNITRLNFSHGEFKQHTAGIEQIRKAATEVNRPIAIMADLPGPKIRIGGLAEEEIELINDQLLTVTTEYILNTTGFCG